MDLVQIREEWRWQAEKVFFFYHPDHLGSASYVADADGNIAQHVEYYFVDLIFIN